MSDNDDERLDRAKRIRKMREGDGREADDEPSESAREETPADDEPVDHGDEPATTPDEDTTSEESEAMNTDNDADETDEEPAVPDVSVPEASTATETADTEDAGGEDDVSAPLPDTEELEEALESAEATADTATPDEVADTAGPAGALDEEESHEEETRVLEFKLGDEYYCLDIDYIEEIVKEETITRVPNTPEYVEGVVDLRGQITTILNPKVTIEKEDISPGGLIIVFDSESFEDQGHIGWVVDDVRQVSPITDDEVNEPPVQEHYINGVIDREEDEQFVIWAEPSMAMEEAE